MRIKTKKFRIKVDSGDMSILDVLISHNSGTGHIGRCNSYITLQSINNLFYELFA